MNKKKFKDIIPIAKIAINSYEKLITKTAKELGLSFGEAHVLLFFYDNDNLINAKDIVFKDKVSKSFVSKTINSLVEKNYIEITIDENDKRYQKIVLNKNTENIINRLDKTRECYKDSIINNISKKELESFLKTLSKIENNICNLDERNKI